MQRTPSTHTRLPRLFKKKSKRTTQEAPGSSSGDAALEFAGTALEVTAAVVDGLNVPGLKGAIQGASAVLKLAQTVKANRADVQGLAEQISKYLTILQGCANYEAEFTKDFGPLVVQLSQDLVHIHGVLEAMAHRKLVKRVFHVTTDKKRITECKERLANHFQAFQLADHCIQDRHRAAMARSIETVQLAQTQVQEQLVDSVVNDMHDSFHREKARFLAREVPSIMRDVRDVQDFLVRAEGLLRQHIRGDLRDLRA